MSKNKRFQLTATLLLTLVLAACYSLSQKDDYPPVTFTVKGRSAEMRGVIDNTILERLKRLMKEHPQVNRIVMVDVEGSVDDAANLEAARYVRYNKFNTLVPSDGVIASGGTDFFLAGVERTVSPGGRVGVHSWGTGEDEEYRTAKDFPQNHPEHDKYLDYYRKMGIPADFYWYTLDAAPFDGIHWMDRTELKKYKLITTG
ncbi:hypothetical protein [Endozoicomonas lisbonensis]|uniref:Alpha/beta hydrolase n=1 Tax=Endozoicomonas lisbonensis TaxID=3120522 RepID=A0ABV2SMA7_9GAMM